MPRRAARGKAKARAKPAARKPNLGAKRARLDGQFNTLLKQEKVQEADEDLQLIVQTLIAEPQKIKGCKAALKSDMFVERLNAEEELDKSVGCLQKIPPHLLKSWLQKKCGMHDETLKKMMKEDKCVVTKCWWWLTGLEGKDALPSRLPSKLERLFLERAAKMKKNLMRALGPNSTMKWSQRGWYRITCVAPGPEGDDTEGSGDTCAKVKIQGYAKEMSLPAFLRVDEQWRIEQNWSLRHAVLTSPANMKPPFRVTLCTLWEDDEEFDSFAPPCPDPDSEEEKDGGRAQKGAGIGMYQISESLTNRLEKVWKA